MKYINKHTLRDQLISSTVLNVWSRRYLRDNLPLRKKPLAYYIDLVEAWESKKLHMHYFFACALFFASFAGVIPYLVYSISDSYQMDFKSRAAFLVLCILACYCLVCGIEIFSIARKNKPRPLLIVLVREYRKVLLAVNETLLWGDYIYADNTKESDAQLLKLQDLDSNETSLPEFLIGAAKSKLHKIGKRISDLESDGESGEAMDLRDGMFTTCFEHAILFGAISEDTDFGEFIPKPTY